MYSKEKIIERLHQHKVDVIQFDPNGVCNSKCWFCPVKYEAHTPSKNISIADANTVLNRIIAEKNRIISPNLRNLTPSHFNEVVLYPEFEKLLNLYKSKGFNFIYLYSNGVAFNKKIVDVVLKHEDIFKEIQFNIPAIEKLEWSKQTGFSPNKFDTLIENLEYLYDVATPKLLSVFNIDINAINEKSIGITKLENFPDIKFNVPNEQLILFKEKFPKFKTVLNNVIYDRDSLLEKNKIFSLKEYVDKNSFGKELVGCQHVNKRMIDGEMGGRFFTVMSINSSGDLFLCCNDYTEKTKFGNIIENSIENVWFSDKHVDMLYNEINQGMCRTCPWAQWK